MPIARAYNLLGLLGLGLAGVAAYNWRHWQRDQALAERLRAERADVPSLSRTPRISALVAAWNEAAHIDAHIQSFLALAYPNIELVICAGGADDTLARAQRYAGERVTVLEQRPGQGKQKALAECYQRAGGELIYLTDADCRFDDEALARLLAPIVNEGEQVTTGGSRPLDAQAGQLLPAYLWASDTAASAQMPAYVAGLLGRNALVARAALDRSGGMEFSAPTGTDYQLARRLLAADVQIRHVPSSLVASEFPASLGIYQRKQARWLRNLLIYGRRSGARADVLTTLRTVVVGAAMLLAPLAALWLGALVLLPWALLLAHSAAAKLRYALFTAQLHGQALPRRLLAGILPLTLADFAIWASPIVDLLLPGRRERW